VCSARPSARSVFNAYPLTTPQFVVVGLTIFTFQSKYDFSSLGPWLTIPLLCLVGTGLIGIFVPFSKTVDMVYAGCGVLVFSLYLICASMVTKAVASLNGLAPTSSFSLFVHADAHRRHAHDPQSPVARRRDHGRAFALCVAASRRNR